MQTFVTPANVPDINELQGIAGADCQTDLLSNDPLKLESDILTRLKETSTAGKEGPEPDMEELENHIKQMEAMIAEGKQHPSYGTDEEFTKTVNGYEEQVKPLRSLIQALHSMGSDPLAHENLAKAFGNTGLMSMNREQRRAHNKKMRRDGKKKR